MSTQMTAHPKWEYWLEKNMPEDHMTTLLKAFGDNMWEAVSVNIVNHGSMDWPTNFYTILFKRFVEAEYREVEDE
jgi:hypothetical protein